MKRKKEVVALVGAYHASMVASREKFIESRGKELGKKINVGTPQEVHETFAGIVETIKASIGGAASGLGLMTPGYRVNTTTFGTSVTDDTIKDVKVTFRNKLNSAIPYTRVFDFSAQSEDIIEKIYDAFIVTLNELAYVEQVVEILDEINATLATIKEENAIAVDLQFGYVDSDEIIIYVTDNAIKFAVSIEGALSATDMGMFQTGDAFSDLCREREIAAYVETMKTIQFAPCVIKANLSIINKVLDSKITRRADKIIRRTYHKKAEFLPKQKLGIGYYSETIGEGDDAKTVFALVEKTEAGYDVILSPFDVRTLEKVAKVDVLKKTGLK